MKKSILILNFAVLALLFFGCRGTYDISKKHIVSSVNPGLPNLNINFDQYSFLFVLGNPTISCLTKNTEIKTVDRLETHDLKYCFGGHASDIITIKSNNLYMRTGIGSSFSDGYMSRKLYGLPIPKIEDFLKTEDSLAFKWLELKFDRKDIVFEENSVLAYQNFITEEIKSNLFAQNSDAPLGVMEFSFPKMETMRPIKGWPAVWLVVGGGTLGIAWLMGLPLYGQICDLTIECTIKDLQGKIIKTYAADGVGHVYSAAFWGYNPKFFTRWYIADTYYAQFANQILPQRVNAISDALTKISKQIIDDSKFIQDELLKNK